MRAMVKPVAFVVLALVVVGGLWTLFKPARTELPAQDGAKAAAPAAMGVPAAAPVQSPAVRDDVFELTINGGKLKSGAEVFLVHQGERVTLNIRSDRRDELHLHGYDLHAQLVPGQIESLQFTADRTGRFGIELHRAHSELGALEVYPQ
jgi:hypothetical protein